MSAPAAAAPADTGPVSDAFWADLPDAPAAPAVRWMGGRLRALVVAALVGCVGLFLVALWLGDLPVLDAAWDAGTEGRIRLAASADPALRPHAGQSVLALRSAGGEVALDDALALHRSSRWIVADADAERHRALRERLGAVLAATSVQVDFAGGAKAEATPRPRGPLGLPVLFWLLGLVALALYLTAMVVLLARPSASTALYLVMTLAQAGNLLVIAVESAVDLGLPAPLPRAAASLRVAFDLVTAAAVANAVCLYPKRLPGSGWIALGVWACAGAVAIAIDAGALRHAWWWAQGGVALIALAAIVLMGWSYHLQPHPFAMGLRRFGLVTLSTWALLTGALAAVPSWPDAPHQVAAIGSTIWYLFFATMLLVVPFLSRSQQILREFALLAVISTVATSLDLLFVAVFSLGQFASVTLTLVVSLAAYTAVRQWIVNQLLGTSMVTTERMFEQLYRIAREVEVHPERVPPLLAELLRELFEPLELSFVDRPVAAPRASGDGSALVVPVPVLGGGAEPRQSIALRFARRGRRLFTLEDARLTARIVDQLQRAVAFDRAVEQGRKEERARLAQDLHDDIGARLLTLMYTAPTPEIEDYVRHTLADLKTLTRGLAAASHRLSHSAAEWKADLSQRLAAAQVQLHWSFAADRDLVLSVVQWSALTRVLRELATNTIAHAQATRLDVALWFEDDRLEIVVADDGVGRNPESWSHGLGLGGIRKRVKQLGGEVEWREVDPVGIRCRVLVRRLSARA